MNAGGELLLYGVFRKLVEYDLRLGVNDYLDAIRALEMQVRDSAVGRPPERNALRRLCQVLWARSPEETRLIDAIFESIPAPSPGDVHAFTNLLRSWSGDEPSAGGELTADRPELRPAGGGDDQSVQGPQAIAIEIQAAGEAGGIPLPYPALPPFNHDTYVMEPQTIVSSRALAVLWRRYRRMIRRGPLTELDVTATVEARCLQGTITRPVFRAGRVNRAKLLILADVSPSMAPWRPFLDAVARSLALSRLQEARIFYFANVPGRSFFRSPALTGALPSGKVFEAFEGAGLLIIGDAGAVRGYLHRQRVTRTATFLESIRRHVRAVVWVNPMPRSRWKGTSAEAIASCRSATFLPLAVPCLIHAVDILRGVKGA
jgi:uncharacterized protein with von Willebrand factor type A (vWA) domain